MTRRETYRQIQLAQPRICVDCGQPATRGFYCERHGRGDTRPMADKPTSTCAECGRPLWGTTRTICLGCLTFATD